VKVELPQHLDWDIACVHCGQWLGDEDEVAALDFQRIADTVWLRSLCACCAAHQDEHPPDGRWIDAGDLVVELGWWTEPPT
jgi:hypothetical protein